MSASRSSEPHRSKSLLALACAATSWGASWPLAKAIVTSLGAIDTAVFASATSSLVLVIACALRRPSISPEQRNVSLVIGILEPGLATLLFFAGAARTSAAASSLIDSLQTLVGAVFATVLLRERRNRRFWLLLVTALVGVSIALGPDFHQSVHASDPFLGDMLIAAGVVAASSYALLVRHYARNADVLAMTMYQSLSALTLITVAAVAVHLVRGNVSTLSIGNLPGLFLLGVIANALPFLLFTWGVQRTSASTGALSLSVIPIVAIFVAWLTLGEELAPLRLLGAALTIFSVFSGARVSESS